MVADKGAKIRSAKLPNYTDTICWLLQHTSACALDFNKVLLVFTKRLFSLVYMNVDVNQCTCLNHFKIGHKNQQNEDIVITVAASRRLFCMIWESAFVFHTGQTTNYYCCCCCCLKELLICDYAPLLRSRNYK